LFRARIGAFLNQRRKSMPTEQDWAEEYHSKATAHAVLLAISHIWGGSSANGFFVAQHFNLSA
jgi:hypothetical protein